MLFMSADLVRSTFSHSAEVAYMLLLAAILVSSVVTIVLSMYAEYWPGILIGSLGITAVYWLM